MEDFLRTVSAALAAPLTPTISVAVAIWLLAGLVALRFNLRGWWRRRLILERALVLERPPRELELARQRHEGELAALLFQVAFVAIGVAVASVPPPPQPDALPWQSLIAGPILIAVQIGLAVESWRQHGYDERRRGAADNPQGEPSHDHI